MDIIRQLKRPVTACAMATFVGSASLSWGTAAFAAGDQVSNPKRFIVCPGPKSRHIKKVIGAFTWKQLSNGSITNDQVKSVARGCRVETDKMPVDAATSKPALTKDGSHRVEIWKVPGGQRLILIR